MYIYIYMSDLNLEPVSMRTPMSRYQSLLKRSFQKAKNRLEKEKKKVINKLNIYLFLFMRISVKYTFTCENIKKDF